MEYQITNAGQQFIETDDSDHTTYEFVVWGRDKHGYPFDFYFAKDVLTEDNHGAHTLVAIAMHEIDSKIPKTIM